MYRRSKGFDVRQFRIREEWTEGNGFGCWAALRFLRFYLQTLNTNFSTLGDFYTNMIQALESKSVFGYWHSTLGTSVMFILYNIIVVFLWLPTSWKALKLIEPWYPCLSKFHDEGREVFCKVWKCRTDVFDVSFFSLGGRCCCQGLWALRAETEEPSLWRLGASGAEDHSIAINYSL